MKIQKTYDSIILTEGSDPIFEVARSLGGYKIASALRNEGYSVFVLSNFTHWMKNGKSYKIMKDPKDGFKPHKGASKAVDFPIQKVHKK